MARGSYGDKYTISVIQGEKHVTLDFTSRVLDFIVMTQADEETTTHGESAIIEPLSSCRCGISCHGVCVHV